MAAHKKFIPDRDSDFAFMARIFAEGIARDPAKYRLSAEDAEQINSVVSSFRDALALTTRPSTRATATIMKKDTARAEAERAIRKFARLIRANDDISADDKCRILIRQRPRRLKRRKCPKEPPYLRFLRSGARGCTHVLEYRNGHLGGGKAKPAGAARLELFADFVPPGQPIPHHPAALTGIARYLRSYSKNPIEVKLPIPGAPADRPMLLVYWGRWADATGEVGCFSRATVAKVEGWPAIPGLPAAPDFRHGFGSNMLEGEVTSAPPAAGITEVIDERRLLDAA